MLAASGQPWFWLDGEAAPAGEARVSYLGIAAEVRQAVGGQEREFLAGLAATAEASQTDRLGDGSAAFVAGWVVALGYEFGVSLMGATPIADTAAPAVAMRADALLVIDHDRGDALVRGRSADVAALSALLGQKVGADPAPIPDSAAGIASPHWRSNDAEYRDEVEACRAAIHDGEAYVLCLTDTAEVRAERSPGWDPLTVYLRSRDRGAAARGGVFVTQERALVSSSPERFLSLRGRTLATHPIKGTRRRGSTPAADSVLASELAADPKERAENLMIVDLMRNDLSRICTPGSVGVAGFLRVETHPHVHQLVSTVTGELLPETTLIELVASCFPGGSMTGAPKRRAVELLAEIEGRPRGLYSGAFGWLDDGGDLEWAMSIRCIEFRGGKLDGDRVCFDTALIGAGGGITADSEPAKEAAEQRLKAEAALAALEC